VPYFCAGCPHNTSTKVPEGSRAQAGIGCHFMASWMDRDTEGLIQMGGEGVDWVSHAMFTKVPHVFQNLGDGTYYHSGYLAIRQAIAAKTNVTYKILFNDAVAMTGGQPVDGIISVDAIARQVEAEGATKVVVLSDDIAKYDAILASSRPAPSSTTAPSSTPCSAGCARCRRDDPDLRADVRRREAPAPEEGRARRSGAAPLHQRPRLRRLRRLLGAVELRRRAAARDRARPQARDRPVDVQQGLLVRQGLLPELRRHRRRPAQEAAGRARGAGGGALLRRRRQAALAGTARVDRPVRPARHRRRRHRRRHRRRADRDGGAPRGHSASVLDFMGFAQKGGSVLSFVRLAQDKAALNQVRIDAQQADAVLACDVVVAASADALLTVRHGRTRVLANRHEIPVAESLSNPDADLRVEALLEKIEFAAGKSSVETMDAQRLAHEFIGDTIVANIVAMGYAWQRGLVPVGLAAMQRAIELNGVAVDANKAAFSLGRLAAADPTAASELLHEPAAVSAEGETLDALIERSARFLGAYQNAAYADRYRRTVAAMRAREQEVVGAGAALPLTRAVAEQLRSSWPTRTSTRSPASTPTASSPRRSPSASKATTCGSSSTWRRPRS
jgi:indolepyruvate ferredoxin oxidoreductase